jgi:hypothetical protein
MRTIKDYQKERDQYLKKHWNVIALNNFERSYSLETREQLKEYFKSGPKKIKPLILNAGPIKISFCPENENNLYCFVEYNNCKNQIWFCKEGLKQLAHNYGAARLNYEAGKDFYLVICADNPISIQGKFLYKFEYQANDTVGVKKYKRNPYGSGEIYVSDICTLDLGNMDDICNYIKTIYCIGEKHGLRSHSSN